MEPENGMVVVSGWSLGEIGICWSEHNHLVRLYISSENLMYNLVIIVNNTILYS